MRIISRKKLREFWERHSDARQALQAWYADVKHANRQTPADIKNVYRNVSIVPHNRAVFNIKCFCQMKTPALFNRKRRH